jgi:hypothetical protein
MRAGVHMLAIMHSKVSADRRSEIARLAAKARWRENPPETTRITVTVSKADHAALEEIRARLGLASQGAVIRKLIRQAAKAKP